MTAHEVALVDLDGTVWRGTELVPGARDGVQALRDAGIEVQYVTNNTGHTRPELVDRLADLGFDVEAEDVISAGSVTGRYLAEHRPDADTFVVGREALRHELRAWDVDVVREGPADVVVGAYTDELDFAMLTETLAAFAGETLFVATNTDRTTPTERGLQPGAGAIVGAIEGMTGTDPFVLGKPAVGMADAVCEQYGVASDRCLVVGDNLHTDVLMGERAGMTTALVLTGASTREEAGTGDVEPDHVVDSLADVHTLL